MITSSLPSLREASFVTGSALLAVISFPDFDLWFLAWISLAPLLIVVTQAVNLRKAFVSGWIWGTIFFYGTCWWLTFPMIHYGPFPAWLAYLLLLLPFVFVALFPAAFCALLCRLIKRFGTLALVLAPILWVSTEWLRYVVTGQLWNALGYSQAFHQVEILPARWGGVYAISAMIVSTNSALALIISKRNLMTSVLTVLLVAAPLIAALGALVQFVSEPSLSNAPNTFVAAVQPNVPMEVTETSPSMDELLKRHIDLSGEALKKAPPASDWMRLVIWPESPMSFSYSRDPHLRQVVGDFARTNQTSILLNSLEPGAHGGDQNSAVLVNEKGEMSARYDKIRLMPFGEYVPLPRWLPGASSVRAIVGEFTPGSSYTLMPLGAFRAGVFICIEAAHPAIARSFAHEGADVLINISNDGYLGPTPVMRQHLANAVFRAVENNRNLLRVTNTGITSYIAANGLVLDQTPGFQVITRTWTVRKSSDVTTFYSRHGDLFVYACALVSLGFVAVSFMKRRVPETGQND
jgi:apolipoprotein N-acyltransferase